MPDIGDLIELTVDIPERHLYAGMQGAIVHCHADHAYEIEFTNPAGETIECLALRPEQFLVVWCAETHQWVSVAEQTASLVTRLPQERAAQVLDFARFLVTHRQASQSAG